jgi:hypothetical protein
MLKLITRLGSLDCRWVVICDLSSLHAGREEDSLG